jgi:Bardet-Biedl syndrome 1 protein
MYEQIVGSVRMATGEEIMKAVQEAEDRAARNVWLHAWHDPVAGLKAYTPCVRFADLSGDGDSKLIVANSDKKLKIYTGTTLLSESIMLDAPVAICTFYPDAKTKPRVPSVGVAAGPFVFIYRNLRPWYKFSLPTREPSQQESHAWASLHGSKCTIAEAKKMLSDARDAGTQLSSTSQELLAIDEPAAAAQFIEEQRDKPLTAPTVATCMEVIKKDLEEDDAVSMLVVGCENGQILILDTAGSSILKQWQLPSAPTHMAITGTKDVEFRIVVACRDGKVHTIKGDGLAGNVIELESLPCGLVRLEKAIVVGCMSNTVHGFSLRGKKMYSIYLPAPIVNMELLELKRTRSAKALMVAMSTGEIRLYVEKSLLATLRVGEPVTACRFGCYGREEGCLAILGSSGGLTIKILQRSCKFDSKAAVNGPPPEQDVPLCIPKKTKLYVEQTQRERDQATEMHRIFQRDLCKLRLSTARAYVKMITDGQGPLSYSSGAALRLTAQVQGLGPRFKIKLSLQNTGSKHVQDLSVVVNYNALIYKVKGGVFTVPVLVPGVAHRVDAELDCIDENGASDTVRVYVCSIKSRVPVLTATVNMPASQILLGNGAMG